jgi:2-oxoglutarate dehydrogenase E1 component
MGAWYYIYAHFSRIMGGRLPLSVVSRPESASPATGSPASHALEQRMLLDAAFGG